VEHAQPIPRNFPWRIATIVVGAIAALELVALLGIGVVRLAPKHAARPAAARAVRHVVPRHVAPRIPSHPLRSRSAVRVLVLNGNGVQGAAGAAASHLQLQGYRIGGTRNAERRYAQSMVLYVPGWVKEARRLAHDAGIQVVAPIDGVRPSQLSGSKLVVILGNA
jgi:hypothetical protein